MHGDSVRLTPNIPPLGLRDVPEECVVCARDLESTSNRNPLSLRVSSGGIRWPSIVIGYACNPCHDGRRDEVRAAQLAVAQRYFIVQQPE
jgi:hypothetical protein